MSAMLDMQGLTKVYRRADSAVEVLCGLDLEIQEGEFAALMGESGSGKSTLLQIMGCLDAATAGRYRLGGQDVDGLDDQSLSRLRNRAIGFVFQTSFFVDYFDLVENVALPAAYAAHPLDAPAARRRAEALLERVGLGHRIHHHPDQLSGGERQRASLARALFFEPWVLLADEPTGNLDAANADRLADLLCELNQDGRTIVLVTHDERVAARAGSRYRLHQGVACRV
jgi:putative ABC transport system ATP-binding protein